MAALPVSAVASPAHIWAFPVRVKASHPRPAGSAALQLFVADSLQLVQDSGQSLPEQLRPRDLLRARHRIQFAECARLQLAPDYRTGLRCTARPTTPRTAPIITTLDTITILTIM